MRIRGFDTILNYPFPICLDRGRTITTAKIHNPFFLKRTLKDITSWWSTALRFFVSSLDREDDDWARAEELVNTGEREEVELISASTKGFVASFGSLIGFLPYRNLAARMKSDLRTRDFNGFRKPGERCVPAAGEELKSGTPAVTRPQRPLAVPMMALSGRWMPAAAGIKAA
ncbi:Nucleic acid-binding [Perilla frutescens var. hirtella]|uniref:Nucleic acid-binding n=1 Tax=Perilla frutescens var. hirtella TaxID=608512 RepID=A0AAD4JL49_PERFH|nr:Nucleic acid-binding [Perilla frutescens var. hirtella]